MDSRPSALPPPATLAAGAWTRAPSHQPMEGRTLRLLQTADYKLAPTTLHSPSSFALALLIMVSKNSRGTGMAASTGHTLLSRLMGANL